MSKLRPNQWDALLFWCSNLRFLCNKVRTSLEFWTYSYSYSIIRNFVPIKSRQTISYLTHLEGQKVNDGSFALALYICRQLSYIAIAFLTSFSTNIKTRNILLQETNDWKHIFRCLLGMDTSLPTDLLKNPLELHNEVDSLWPLQLWYPGN